MLLLAHNLFEPTPVQGNATQVLARSRPFHESRSCRRLIASARDPADLVAEKFCAARGRMANLMCVDIQFLELRCCNVAKSDDFVTRKKIEESFEHRQASGSLGLVRHSVAQNATTWIKRMPRERIPQGESPVLRRASAVCSRRWSPSALKNHPGHISRFTRSPCLNAGKNLFRLNAIFLFSDQDSLGSHGDSTEVTAAIAKCFANYGDL